MRKQKISRHAPQMSMHTSKHTHTHTYTHTHEFTRPLIHTGVGSIRRTPQITAIEEAKDIRTFLMAPGMCGYVCVEGGGGEDRC